MTSAADQAVQFSLDMLKCQNSDECTELFLGAILSFGMERFVCCDIDLASRNITVIYATTWSEPFIRYYFSSGLIKIDPMLDALEDHSEPFEWSELRREGKIKPAGQHAFDVYKSYDVTDGLFVHLKKSETKYGIVSSLGKKPDLAPDVRASLITMSVCLYERVRRLPPKIAAVAQYMGLTPREMDCLRLLTRGLTDKEIGARLQIAPSTAHEYVESAKSKLGVATRTEAAAIAVSMRLADR